MLEAYFEPLRRELVHAQDGVSSSSDTLAFTVRAFLEGTTFPELEGCRLAIFGVDEDRGCTSNAGCGGGADLVRQKFYQLKRHQHPLVVADLGNLRRGLTLQDTYSAVSVVVNELLQAKIIPVLLGGGQDLTYGFYGGYKLSEQIINIVALDARFDLGVPEEAISNASYLGKIILEQPNYLFNFSNIGYQTYFTGSENVALMKKLHFETIRLGHIRQDIQEAEPIVRNADLLSVDISVVRQSDAPGNGNASPNGLHGEELCQILLYAGLSDKLSGLGFFEYNPVFDRDLQTAHLYAHALWYFSEGVSLRKMDTPLSVPSGYFTYRVALEELDQEIVFVKSLKTQRWWIKLPTDGIRNRYVSQHLLPCSYKDYMQACRNEVPERWWNAVHKMV